MPRFSTLDIRGFHGEPVRNAFIEQEETSHLAILLPGLAYTCQAPLLYYSSFLLMASGADVLEVEYDYSSRHDFAAASPEGKQRWLQEDVGSAVRAALSHRRYSSLTLVGKSLGTLGVAYLLSQAYLPGDVQVVWLTPLLANDDFRRQIERSEGLKARHLFVIGSKDGQYDEARLAAVSAITGGQTLVIEGADHSLEIEGDLYASLKALELVIHGIEEFLR